MAAVKTFNAVARREGNWWVVEVAGVGVTQAKRLDQVDHMAKDMVAIMEDVDSSHVQIDVEVHVSDEIDSLRAETEELSREAENLAAKARSGKEHVMRQLQEKARLSARDIGRLTGVSHQRVSQVIGRKAGDKVHRRNVRTGRPAENETEPQPHTESSR